MSGLFERPDQGPISLLRKSAGVASLRPEAEAVFRMLEHRKRDIFEFADGKQITLDDLPAGLIFDVLVVPGSEQLSAVLNMEPRCRTRKSGTRNHS